MSRAGRVALAACLAACLASAARALSAPARLLPATFPVTAAAEDSLLQHAIDDLSLRADLLELDAATDVRVLNVAAHPDDEDGPSLTLLRHAYGYRTHILYMTRGEGGQNEVGPGLGDELGWLRSLECQQAAAGYGATISFLNCPDFGYSKTAEETLARWGEDETLRRLMAELRLLDADIIVTHHTPEEGHGHHRATSILLRRACRELQRLGDTAAPAVLLERIADGDSATVFVDASGAAPGVPWSLAGRAHVALRRHVTQGMALGPTPAQAPPTAWRAVDGVGSFDAIARWASHPTPWAPRGIPRLVPAREDREAETLLVRAQRLRRGEVLRLEHEVQPLRGPSVFDRRSATMTATEVGWIRLTGAAATTVSQLLVGGGVPVDMRVVASQAGDGSRWDLRYDAALPSGGPNVFASHPWVPTVPRHRYWRERRTVGDSLEVWLVRSGGGRERLHLPLHERASHLLEFPAPRPYAVPGGIARFAVRISGFDRPQVLAPGASPQLKLRPTDGGELRVSLWVGHYADGLGDPYLESLLVLATDGALDTSKLHSLEICRPGSPDPALYERDAWTAVLTLPVVPLATPAELRLGVAVGVDTLLVRQLGSAAIPVTVLGGPDLSEGRLRRFNAIVVDARAYALHPWLRAANGRLLEWVRGGGHLVVLMHKSFDWQTDDATVSPLPPLPLHVGRARVCEEAAAVAALAPRHPFFHFPHELDASTWSGWHQERGLYYPESWDPAFTPLVRMNDMDEPPLDGGILTARFGKGAYTYTCLAWGRQLREAHPGALRAFINLLSWPLAPRSD